MKYHRILTYVAAATIGLAATVGPTYAKEERKKECAKVEQRGCGELEKHVRQKIGERIGKIKTIGDDLKALKQYKLKGKKQNAKYQASVDSIIENYASLYTFPHRGHGAKPELKYNKECPKKPEGKYHKGEHGKPEVHKHGPRSGKPECKYSKEGPRKPDVHKHDHRKGKPECKKPEGEKKHISWEDWDPEKMKARLAEKIKTIENPEHRAGLEKFLKHIEERQAHFQKRKAEL